MLAEFTDSGRTLVHQSLAAALAWLASAAPSVATTTRSRESESAKLQSPVLEPMSILAADPLLWRRLSTVEAGQATSEWGGVLDSLLVLAVRRYDLDALATLLQASAELGLSARPIHVRAVGFLVAQQQTDGGFGFAGRSEERSEVEVRIYLTRNCAAALQRICEPEDSRMRKNPSSRSPSPAMP
ncbi:hypothetical protein [Nocardia sp. NPDC050175]|uniref:hypothetical protein n=1 Tax=Nocardia sp. NPDC050175 TaxID=3364317 RepID=UPI0037B1A77E